MRYAALAIVVLLAGCEGPMGPEGPQGAPGPGTIWDAVVQMDAYGYADVALPAGSGTGSEPPLLSCYVAENRTGPWLVVATSSSTGPVCGIVQDSGTLYAVMVNGLAYGYFRAVVIY